MDKLTIEEKAKRYDEVIGRVVNIKTGKCETTFIFTEGLFDYLFPELEECNEEEVRKAMIDFFKHEREEGVVVSHYGVNIERMIAWLEKQKAVDILDEEEREFADNVDSYRKEVDAAYQKGYNEGVKATLEKQGEQKPQGKSALEAIKEEKVDNANKVEPKDYNSIDPHFGKPTDKIEPKFHEKDWSIDDYLWQITAKEQLDVLYTKIKEAGYEWDDEKKEFKKIKNPAWSEEDEAVVKDICDKLSWLRVIYTGNQNIACQKDIYWLKSLKGRVGCEANFTTMWKPSEKQIMCLQDALSDYHRRGYKAETLETLLKQLKQL